MPPKEVNSRRRKATSEPKTPIKKARTEKVSSVKKARPQAIVRNSSKITDAKKTEDSIERRPRPRKTKVGVVLTCGNGEVGQLGLGPDILEKKRFALVPDLENVVDICAGGMHTVCLTSDGTVYTFGCDDEGALGRMADDENSFTPMKVKLDGPAVQISAGDSHSAALLEDGRVFAWGSFRDSHGTMGLTEANKSDKTPTLINLDQAVEKIASGADHLLLMTVVGQLFSCGCPEQGQLGRVTARSANRDSRLGNSLLSFLYPKAIIFRRNIVFTDIWASSYGTYAKVKNKNDEMVYRCGLNNYHQLGLKTEGPIFNPVPNGPLGVANENWLKLEGGDHHTLLLDSAGKVFCLGRKEYGRLGLGKDAGDAHAVTIVPKLAEDKFVDIACGSAVSFAVSESGEIWGWGMGNNGQLSTGDDEDDLWEPQKLKAKQLENRKVLLAAAGGQHTVLLATA